MPKFIERRLTKLKLTSVSKSALAAMLVSGVLAATPVLANADSSSGESDVTVQTTKGKAKLNDDLRISIKNNDDGTKTISITVPNADITKEGSQSLNNATFNVKTDSDTNSDSQTSVSSGDVKQNSDQSNAKFKIDLNKSALDNDQLMNDNLTITVRDSNGHTLGTISNVTANELLKAAQQQKASQQQKAAESQSSSATSQSSSSASNEAAQSSAVISSKADTTDPSNVVISSESTSAKDINSDTKVGADTAVSSANSSSAKNSDNSSKAADSNNGENNTTVPSQTPSDANTGGQAGSQSVSSSQAASHNSSSQNGANGGNGNQAQAGSGSQSGQGQAADQGNSQNADNSQLPQTSNGGTYQSSIGVLGLISAVFAAFGLKKAKHN